MVGTQMLERLKGELEDVYEIHVPLAIDDFLTTDRSTAAALADGEHFSADESLFVVEGEDETLVTLFIDDAIMHKLDEDDPLEDLHDGNFAPFCTALEGVSHFIYLAWRAGFDRSVTQLELEMQAEVDKFVTSRMLIERQQSAHVWQGRLAPRLFEHIRFRDDLDLATRSRYQAASDFAERYCRRLAKRWDGCARTVQRDLCRFYRLDEHQKIRHIARAK